MDLHELVKCDTILKEMLERIPGEKMIVPDGLGFGVEEHQFGRPISFMSKVGLNYDRTDWVITSKKGVASYLSEGSGYECHCGSKARYRSCHGLEELNTLVRELIEINTNN